MSRSNIRLTSVLLLSAIAGQGLAANCFNSPKWGYFKEIYDDVWNVRGKLCGGSGDCTDNVDGTVTCKADVGAGIAVVYAGFFGTNRDDALNNCWVSYQLPLFLSYPGVEVSWLPSSVSKEY